MNEVIIKPIRGDFFSVVHLCLLIATVWGFQTDGLEPLAGVFTVIALVFLRGYFTVLPGSAKLLFQWGNYIGTVKKVGFHWSAPWATRKDFSLRQHAHSTPKFHLTDKNQCPIEWQAHIQWQIVDTAKAAFLVGNFEKHIEAVVFPLFRSMALSYPIQSTQTKDIGLISHLAALSKALQKEANKGLSSIGLEVVNISTSQLRKSQRSGKGFEAHLPELLKKTEALLEAYQNSSLPGLSAQNQQELIKGFLLASIK